MRIILRKYEYGVNDNEHYSANAVHYCTGILMPIDVWMLPMLNRTMLTRVLAPAMKNDE